MTPFINDRDEQLKFRHAVYLVASFTLVLWVIKALELATDTSLAKLGILPRTLRGAIGIVTGPLIHGDILHLLSNTLPLLSLGVLLFYFYHRIALEIFGWIYLVTGFWTWLLARNAYHIGASGIVYGMAAFLFFGGMVRRSRQMAMVSAIIIILYGGMVYGIFPEMVDFDVSWESHLLGALAGALLAFFFRKSQTGFEPDYVAQEEEKEKDDGAYFTHTSITDQVDVKYEYKPGKQKTKE
ncbi:MAG: rhomboid family intramembrane serine protease [Cyclobacteriaceae bacterium]|nr:rhomboid family intramembrane serine protease [Cyclobacteriaceae bacterium]